MSDKAIESSLLETRPSAVIATDLEGRILSWNEAAERLYGWPASEALGRSVYETTVADESFAEAQEIMALLRNGESWEGTFLLRRRDGSTFLGHVVDTGIYDSQGQLTGIIGVSEDIEERNQRRMALAKTVEALGSSLNVSGHLNDLPQRVTDAATALTGAQCGAFFYSDDHPGGEDPGLPVVSSAPGGAFDRFPMPRSGKFFSASFEGRESVRISDITADPESGAGRSASAPDQSAAARSYLAVPVRSTNGEPLGCLVFAHAEPDAFAELDEEIAETVAAWAGIAFEHARTLRDVEQARNEVTRLNGFKDELLELVSHEFRTPVTTLAGLADFIGRRGPVVSQRELTEISSTMTEAADRLRLLVENTLVLARVESNDAVSLEPVLVQRILTRAVEAWQRKHAERTFLVSVEGVLPSVNGNESLLALVAENLLSNAVKFSPQTNPIEIRTWAAESTAVVVVRDGGRGLDASELSQAFDPFVRFAPAIPGAGLGLAVCERIIGLHNGKITAANHSNGGLEVRFELPGLESADA